MFWVCYYFALRRSRQEAAWAAQPASWRAPGILRRPSKPCGCLPKSPDCPALRWLQRVIACSIEASRRSAPSGKEWPLSAVRDIMAAADVAFLNLETSIARGGARLPGKGIWFRSAPEFAQELADAGIDVVTLANNHVLDYDDPAFDETLSNLSAAGIDVCGGGKNMAEARRPAVLSANGISVAFLGYSEFAHIYWSVARPKRFVAGEASPGISPWDRGAIVEDIRRAKRLADHVVVSFHWGDEYVSMPADRQVQLAHAAIDAGASVRHGHHPTCCNLWRFTTAE